MKIGIVDLDTSHPRNWIPIERELGHEVAGILDSGDVHPPLYAKEFSREHSIPRVYDDLSQMARDVDCAIIHSCDWDSHVAKAAPFVEAGKAVLVDKPIAGNIRDLEQFRKWVRQGARITGGSSLRFCDEKRQWLAQDVAKRGAAHTVFAGCAVDDFNYGIHAYSLISGIMGPGIKSVRHLGRHVQRRVQVDWADGRTAILVIGAADNWLPFHASICTDKQVTQFIVESGKVYAALLNATLPYLAGVQDRPPVEFDQLIEPELAAIAAMVSWTEGDRVVQLTELDSNTAGYDGAEFARLYRKQKYPKA